MSLKHPLKRAGEAVAIAANVPSSPSGSFVAGVAVGAVTKWDLVELVTDGSNGTGVQLPASAGNRCLGVALNTAAIGEAVDVQTAGLGFVRCGATLTSPDELSGATDGDAVASATTNVVAATLLEDGVDTEVKRAMIHGLYGHTLP